MFPPAATIIVTLRIPFYFNTPTWDLCSPFFLLVSQQQSLFFSSSLFLAIPHITSPHILLYHSLPSNPRFIFFPPDCFASPMNLLLLNTLPALADCQCLRVTCGHFSFIILSKSGMALAQGDWVSVKHQELIEFVLKWLIEGTLLMQS